MQQSGGLLLAASSMAATPLFSFAIAKENANESVLPYFKMRKAGPSKQSGGLFARPWLFRRKANPIDCRTQAVGLWNAFNFGCRKLPYAGGLLLAASSMAATP